MKEDLLTNALIGIGFFECFAISGDIRSAEPLTVGTFDAGVVELRTRVW